MLFFVDFFSIQLKKTTLKYGTNHSVSIYSTYFIPKRYIVSTVAIMVLLPFTMGA